MGISFLLGDSIILGKREGYIDFPAPERRFRIAVRGISALVHRDAEPLAHIAHDGRKRTFHLIVLAAKRIGPQIVQIADGHGVVAGRKPVALPVRKRGAADVDRGLARREFIVIVRSRR